MSANKINWSQPLNMDPIIVTTLNHPYYPNIRSNWGIPMLEITSPDQSLSNLRGLIKDAKLPALILDFTLFEQKSKEVFLKNLSKEEGVQFIFSEGAVNACYLWENMFPKVLGVFSLGFMLPMHLNFEYTFFSNKKNNPKFKNAFFTFTDFFEAIGTKPKSVHEAGIGFYGPRTLSLIINEALSLLEQGIASKQDIDLAMKEGVGHPMGPLEWVEKIGPKKVLWLLDTLFEHTHDPRYRATLSLRSLAEGKELA